jgi:hypothetical protein
MGHGKKGYIDKKLSEGRGPLNENSRLNEWWRRKRTQVLLEQIHQELWELTREGRRQNG